MEKSTKFCELVVHLASGARVVGNFHIPIRTGSAIRPSDAIRENKDSFLLLTNATIRHNEDVQENQVLMIHFDAISYIELSPDGWIGRPRPE